MSAPPLDLNGLHLEGSLAVQVFEQVALVRLIPGQFEGGHRPDVQPVDVVVLDISMPGESGIRLLPKLKLMAPHSRVLIVSMHLDPRVAARAVAAGAGGYLTKESAPEELVSAIRKLVDDTAYGKQDQEGDAPQHSSA